MYAVMGDTLSPGKAICIEKHPEWSAELLNLPNLNNRQSDDFALESLSAAVWL